MRGHAPQPLWVRPQSLPTRLSGPAPVHMHVRDSGLALRSLLVLSCAPGPATIAIVWGQDSSWGRGTHPVPGYRAQA